jgi:hypothetical protein
LKTPNGNFGVRRTKAELRLFQSGFGGDLGVLSFLQVAFQLRKLFRFL